MFAAEYFAGVNHGPRWSEREARSEENGGAESVRERAPARSAERWPKKKLSKYERRDRTAKGKK